MGIVLHVQRRPAIGYLFGVAFILIFLAGVTTVVATPKIGRLAVHAVGRFQQWQVAQAQRNEQAMRQRYLDAVKECEHTPGCDRNTEAQKLGLVDPPTKPVPTTGGKK